MPYSAKYNQGLADLDSDKVKERQEAQETLKSLFLNESVVNHLMGRNQQKEWVRLMNALFMCIKRERESHLKKITAASGKRLSVAAGSIRWFVSRCKHLFDAASLTQFFSIASDVMISQDQLLKPVALDLLKAMTETAQETVNVELIVWSDEWDLWAQLAFNILMDGPLTTSFTYEDMSEEAETIDSDEEGYARQSSSNKRSRVLPRNSSSKRRKVVKPMLQREPITSPSSEQLESASLILALLRPNVVNSRIIQREVADGVDTGKVTSTSVIKRLAVFLEIYPFDSSLHYDYLQIVLAAFPHFALNNRDEIIKFASKSWSKLTSLWGTRNKHVKEALVSVLHVLFPYVVVAIHGNAGNVDTWIDEVQRSWAKMYAEGANKWTPLSVDALRLDLTPGDKSHNDEGAFMAGAFRAGHNFTQPQALAWTILKFQADCAAKLCDLGESDASYGHERVRIGGTHRDPIDKILSSLKSSSNSLTRTYELQLLLFIIDFHWHVLHSALRERVIITLSEIVSQNVPDNATILSWTFLCIASVAHADQRLSGVPLSGSSLPWTSIATVWATIWNSTIRRVHAPIICRAACHAAHALLLHVDTHSTAFPSPPLHNPMSDIESLAKDIDVQGPNYPYESVASFLSLCLRKMSSDMRLHRMQLEDKVLTWLIECWKLVRVEGDSLPGYTVKDMLLLLETVCSLNKHSDLLSIPVLASCQVVETVEREHRTTTIRNYLLYGDLPETEAPLAPDKHAHDDGHKAESVQPNNRQRRLSIFLLQSLETLSADWALIPQESKPSPVKVRKSLDIVVTVLAFQGVLDHNGVHSANEKIVTQTAGNAAAQLIARATASWWSPAERLLVLAALEPIISVGDQLWSDAPFADLVMPDIGSGIKSQLLQNLVVVNDEGSSRRKASRHRFLEAVWCNVENTQNIQTSMMKIIGTMWKGFSPSDGTTNANAMDVDDDGDDGFGTIRTAAVQPNGLQQELNDVRSIRAATHICMTFLAKVPAFVSKSTSPTRDQKLVDTVLACSCPNTFIHLSSILFEQFKSRNLRISSERMKRFFERLEDLRALHDCANSAILQLLVIQFFDSVFEEWASSQASNAVARKLLKNLFVLLKKEGILAWEVRDALCRLLGRFIVEDPQAKVWPKSVMISAEDLLMSMNHDSDMRVRFRAAVLSSLVLKSTQAKGEDPTQTFYTLRNSLTLNLSHFEELTTRILCLANAMITSSATRRGSYWNVIEISLSDSEHKKEYNKVISTVLTRASQRLGLDGTSLFEAYGSQIADCLLHLGRSIDQFPPHLLGHSDRKEFVSKAFTTFTPINLTSLNGIGHHLFQNHCALIGVSEEDGIAQCFGDIVGHSLILRQHQDEESLLTQLKVVTRTDPNAFDEVLRSNLDSVFASILSSLVEYNHEGDGTFVDYDISDTSGIVGSLARVTSIGKANDFISLCALRKSTPFMTHEPNAPHADATTILESFRWLDERWVEKRHVNALTYHVLQKFFASMEKSVLVNEQMRLLNGVCLWIAYRHRAFDDPTLLHVLMRNAASLLNQPDIARGAQSILAWAFKKYREQAASVKDSRFPDILIRISRISYEYSLSSNEMLASLGRDLSDWIDSEASLVSGVNQDLEEQVQLALPTWSRSLSHSLQTLYDKMSAVTMSSTLQKPSITANKFHLVVCLRDLAHRKEYETEDFLRDFWLLKQNIPSANRLRQEDIHAFTDLLMWNKAQIDGFARGSSRQTETKARDVSPQMAIVNMLLAMMSGNDVIRGHVAYLTLRSIVGATDQLIGSGTYGDEVPYLQVYPLPPVVRHSRHIEELFASNEFLNCAHAFSTWITSITSLLSGILSQDDPFYGQLVSIIPDDSLFAHEALPVLVQVTLQKDVTEERHSASLTRYFTLVLSSDSVDVSCIRSIIEIVLHLRTLKPGTGKSRSKDPLHHDKWLDIDYILLAQAAVKCGSYTTGLLFLELAAEYDDDVASKASTVEQLMYDIYSNIDEPDGFYGIQTSDLRTFLLNRFHHENQWDKAFMFHSAALEAGSTEPGHAEGLLKSLSAFGFNRLASVSQQESMQLEQSGMAYKLGWRTGTWDIPEGQGGQDSSLYLALRALHVERDPEVAKREIQRALLCEMERLRVLGSENVTQIQEVLRNLVCLHQVSALWKEPFASLLASQDTDITKWTKLSMLDTGFDFPTAENVMATRLSIVRSTRKREDERSRMGDLLSPFSSMLRTLEKNCLLHVSEIARREEQTQIALNSVICAERLANPIPLDVSEEFANVLWAHREERSAVELLKSIRDCGQGRANAAVMNVKLGSWTAHAYLEKPTKIWAEFFELAVNLVSSSMDRDSSAAVHQACADFAEKQYYVIAKSPEFIRFRMYIERRRQELEERTKEAIHLKQSEVASNKRAIQQVESILLTDKTLYQQGLDDRDSFLRRAIENYSRCLQLSDKFDDEATIRFCSLWLSNFEEDAISNDVSTSIERVPSHKFVFLAHQLVARLSTKRTKSQNALQSLIMRMCSEHPFHSVYQLLCIASVASSTQSSPETGTLEPVSDRGTAGASLVSRLCNSLSGVRVQNVQSLCQAAVDWASFPIKDNKKYKTSEATYSIPVKLQILNLGTKFNTGFKVPVMTVHEEIDRTTAYNRCTWLWCYASSFKTAGGINLPKITTCRDENANDHKQLFKGEGRDDLRQDTVMEQVFELVNAVLDRDRHTKRRELQVRDYKVIPLSSSAGVLEFVDKTIPMRTWLAVAHQRYKTKEMLDVSQAHVLLNDTHAKHKNTPRMVEEFARIRNSCPPVMRHYFTEHHKDPMSWFKMRLNYTRSVATTSIVGHVLGLGDRHTSNILLDTRSGEVVHIDLGIAFDQGKSLRVPERVPFRMTSNIVDGMGITGTDGVFQRCAEETLRVLREGRGVIMTILEVFRYDPLHSWTTSDFKAAKAQRIKGKFEIPIPDIKIGLSSGNAEEAADRALNGVSSKLDPSLSVASAVSGLVAEAKDPENLANMFPGWMSHV